MSATKFTRGPYKVMPQEKGVSYMRVRGTRLGCKYKIANCPFDAPECAGEAEANAHLIAAAPELYEALEAAERARREAEAAERLRLDAEHQAAEAKIREQQELERIAAELAEEAERKAKRDARYAARKSRKRGGRT